MEKHRCKLCHRRFANGRALGGHMRYHMMNLAVPPKAEPPPSSDDTESSSSSSSSSSDSEPELDVEEEDEDGRGKGLLLKLREKRVKLSDLEFWSLRAEAAGSSSITLQDRESESESSKNPTRRRSKRQRRPPLSSSSNKIQQQNQVVAAAAASQSDHNEGEPVSSISEVTSEEDLAYCLMMLSRDKWSACNGRDFGDKSNDIGTDSYEPPTPTTTKKQKGASSSSSSTGKYRCETCNKVFRSYQALGGHRASHKKIRVAGPDPEICSTIDNKNNKNNNVVVVEVMDENQQKKIHECPVCFRVFGSGQALGGHKRSHVISGIDTINNNQQPPNDVQSPKKMVTKESTQSGINFIDLNLPAPIDDDDDQEEISQIALSVVSHVHL